MSTTGNTGNWNTTGGIPYMPAPGTLSIGVRGSIFVNANTTVGKSYYCRYCGEAITNPYYSNAHNQMCDKCEKEIFGKFWAEKIPQTSEYCQDCKSHMKACKCPKKKALDNLRL